jgi:hypothetical protein
VIIKKQKVLSSTLTLVILFAIAWKSRTVYVFFTSSAYDDQPCTHIILCPLEVRAHAPLAGMATDMLSIFGPSPRAF